MDRKTFIKSAGLLTGGLFLIPKELFSQPQDHLEWFEENYYWLEKWLDNYKIIPGKPTITEISKSLQLFTDYVQPENLIAKIEAHKKEIIAAAVFSKYSFIANKDRIDKVQGEYYDAVTMSGFVEQTGRLPKKSDKVMFEICPPDSRGQRFLRVRDAGDGVYQLLSDCRLKIVGA